MTAVNGAQLAAELVPVAELVTYHRNPRQGNVNAIAESLDTLGQYRPIVVNRGTHTDRPHEVVAGNHTLAAARKLGWTHVSAVHVDVDDDTCARIVAADNRTADLGGYDDRLLAELLSDLPDLDGTGYDHGDLDDLLVALEQPADLAADPDRGRERETDPADAEGDEGFNRYEHRDEWENAGRRMVILDYPLDTYVWVQDQLAALAQEFGTDSNADTITRLIAEHTDAEAPGA